MSLLRRISLTQWILISMVVGSFVGWAAPDFAVDLKPPSTISLRMITGVIVPIMFAALVIGRVAGILVRAGDGITPSAPVVEAGMA